MNIKLTEKEQRMIEVAAVQKVIQDHIQGRILARAAEIDEEIRSTALPDMSLVEISQKFLGEGPLLATPTPGILVPKH